MDLLMNTLELDENMLHDMGGAIRSEIFCAALILMQALSSDACGDATLVASATQEPSPQL